MEKAFRQAANFALRNAKAGFVKRMASRCDCPCEGNCHGRCQEGGSDAGFQGGHGRALHELLAVSAVSAAALCQAFEAARDAASEVAKAAAVAKATAGVKEPLPPATGHGFPRSPVASLWTSLILPSCEHQSKLANFQPCLLLWAQALDPALPETAETPAIVLPLS